MQPTRAIFFGISGLLAATFLLARTSAAQGTPCDASFPMDAVVDHGGNAGLELHLREAEAQLLAGTDHALLHGVPLPDGTSVDVEVRRIVIDDSQLEVRVDGAPARQADEILGMWSGKIPGDADSDVYLAFSPLGSRGWIRRGGETYHLLAGPGEGGDWTKSISVLVSEASLLARGDVPPTCAGDPLIPPGRHPATPRQSDGSHTSFTATTLVCRMAVETDYQLFTRFADLGAEQTYITQLFGAGNARYVEQINTVLQRVYIAYYTNPADPWVTADNGGNSVDMLYEFQGAYPGGPPNGGNLGHFFSGANLGGGVAWLDVLCDPDFGWAVSGNITLQGGQTPFPVVQGPANWDFMVFTHEIGHNFGTPHTHDFCPPIDQCAPSGYFGQCQVAQVCINNGTIMSYCHLCPGGVSNIYPYFHQQCADLMRQRAEASCLGPWCTGPANYCLSNPNSTGLPGSISGSGSTSIAANSFTMLGSNLPPNKTALFIYGANQVQLPLGQGYRCVNPIHRFPVQNTGAGGSISRLVNFTQPPAGSGSGKINPGTSWNFQVYHRDIPQGTINLSDAMAVPFCP